MDSPHTVSDPSQSQVSHLKQVVLTAVLDPLVVRQSTVSACEDILTTPGLDAEAYDWAVRALAAILYSRPELVGESAVRALTARLSVGPTARSVDRLTTRSVDRLAARRLPPAGYRRIGEVLAFLLATEAAPSVVDAVIELLSREDLSAIARSVSLDVLSQAARWRPDLVDLETVVRIVECDHPVPSREFLRENVLEPCIFADPGAVTPSLLDRLTRLYAGYPAFTYQRYYLCQMPQVPAPTRAAACVEGPFSLHETVVRELQKPGVRVLVIQNIADGQGDEIIRVVPIVQALLDFNPHLAVVIVTDRSYLYAHPRITVVPIDDRERVASVLGEPFHVVVDFYESNVRQVNHDPTLESQVQAAVQAQPPFVYVGADKGYNHFDYRTISVGDQRYDLVPRTDRQHVANVYAPAFRLIAELGLPLRAGEDSPMAGPVLAAIASEEADELWARVTARRSKRQPVALVNPFGGAEPLKGYTAPQFEELAGRIRDLVAEGFFVVLLPNGEAWGTAALAREVVGLLAWEQDQVAIAADPQDVTVTLGIPGPAGAMRLFIYFARFADLVVTVEGWMMHAAYCLGKPFRVLMLPYSHGFDWQPYGRTRNQGVVCGPIAPPTRASMLMGSQDVSPLAEQPRKSLLRFVLTALGECCDPKALVPLHRAVRSEDRDLRLVAVEALARHPGDEIDGILRGLLRDPARRVRAAAASALLHIGLDRSEAITPDEREQLLDGSEAMTPSERERLPDERERLEAYVRLGARPLQWEQVLQLGAAACNAVEAALEDDDAVVRREARAVYPILTQGYRLGRTQPEGKADAGRRKRLSAILPRPHRAPARARADGPRVLILTPVKDATDYLAGYCERLSRLTYPHDLVSVAFLESDSTDNTYGRLQARMPSLRSEFRRAGLWKRDFGYRIREGLHRATDGIQVERRSVLARSRNHLLSHALDDEDWVLWLDVDVIDYPADVIERLLAAGKDIVQPNCVLEFGGRTFDTNGWQEQGRLHLDDLRGTEELVQLDAVGGAMLLVRADLHRDGLVFPTFLYGQESPRIRWNRVQVGEIETEGLGIMAYDMGYTCWGMPNLEIRHDRR